MLKIHSYSQLSEADIRKLTARNTDADHAVGDAVLQIMDEVKAKGDAALRAFSEKFDRVSPKDLVLREGEIEASAADLGRDQQRALEIAFQNIHKFHSAQLRRERRVETMPGVACWREARPIERVGLYVPGGSAVLPSTLLMLGVPARIAGCREIVVCSPPQANGSINAALAYCLRLLKIDRIYLAGGAQAIAAMAYGTASVPKVDKIFGPGNPFVTKAKTLVQGMTNVAIDMPAGPSEVLVVADETARPEYVAADLLAQAEHGPDSQAVLVTTSVDIVAAVNAALAEQMAVLPRAEIARAALQKSYAVVTADLHEAVRFSNAYAPEHLILETDHWEALARHVGNAGSVFLGHLTPESAGDYASGTNHTLPTSGYARSYSGVSVDAFVKKITFQHISEEGMRQIGSTVEVLAEMEGLHAHRNTVTIRKNVKFS